MNKNTSIVFLTTIAGIMTASALAVTATNTAFATAHQSNTNLGVNDDSHSHNGNHNAYGHDKTPSGDSSKISNTSSEGGILHV